LKRFLLIAAGTAGGLGAVLAVTPPQLGASASGLGVGTGNSAAVSNPAASKSAAPTQRANPAPTSAATGKNTPAPTKTATPTPAPTAKSKSGTFTGSAVDVNFGLVQVEIKVSNGKITDARALQAPSGRSDRYSSYALPILREQTLAAQSTNIQGASGASYTTYGWRLSLQEAMAKAGL